MTICCNFILPQKKKNGNGIGSAFAFDGDRVPADEKKSQETGGRPEEKARREEEKADWEEEEKKCRKYEEILKKE